MSGQNALRFDVLEGQALIEPTFDTLLIAGWTGRDDQKVRHHIEELAAIGVARPSTTPLYYRAPVSLLSQSEEAQVLGEDSGGEIEPVVFSHNGALHLSIGSDHTDRALETTSVAHSKAVCVKPLGRTAWPLDSLSDRLDDLRLRSEISEDGVDWTLYQDGAVRDIRSLSNLIADAPGAVAGRLPPGALLFCGTVPAIGGVRPTSWFRGALIDDASGRSLSLVYRAKPLSVVA